MGSLNKLLQTGLTVAGTVAAVKVAEKVKENNPNGIQDVNGDGKVDLKDYYEETKKAAQETFTDCKQKAPGTWEQAKRVISNTFKNS